MTIAGSILLIAIGAILTFAVNASVQGVDLDVIGWILMAAGLAGLILGFFQEAIWTERRREAAEERERPREPPPRY